MANIKDGLVKVAENGYMPKKKLGGGVYGVAFSLANRPDRVLKITTDVLEAKAMGLMLEKPHPNIVKVFKVWMYRSLKGLYFIEQEMLSKNKKLAEGILSIWSNSKEGGYQTVSNILLDYSRGDANKATTIKQLKLVKTDHPEKKKYIDQLFGVVEHMRNVGIKGWDIHYGNIMFKNGKVKAIDLGANPSGGKIKDIRDWAI